MPRGDNPLSHHNKPSIGTKREVVLPDDLWELAKAIGGSYSAGVREIVEQFFEANSMNSINPEQIIQAQVNSVVRNLTTNECAALHICFATGGNPLHVMGYAKIKSLCTEGEETKMHSLTLNAFLSATLRRIEATH